MDLLYLLRNRLVTATARIHPLASQGLAVSAERPFIVGWGILLAKPDHECVAFEFIHIFKGITLGVIIARFDICTWILSIFPLMSDDFDSLFRAKINVLN